MILSSPPLPTLSPQPHRPLSPSPQLSPQTHLSEDLDTPESDTPQAPKRRESKPQRTKTETPLRQLRPQRVSKIKQLIDANVKSPHRARQKRSPDQSRSNSRWAPKRLQHSHVDVKTRSGRLSRRPERSGFLYTWSSTICNIIGPHMSLYLPTLRRPVEQTQTFVGGVRSHARIRWRCYWEAALQADRGPFSGKDVAGIRATRWWRCEADPLCAAGILILPPLPREGTNTHAGLPVRSILIIRARQVTHSALNSLKAWNFRNVFR
jgi:hypothetical protein